MDQGSRPSRTITQQIVKKNRKKMIKLVYNTTLDSLEKKT